MEKNRLFVPASIPTGITNFPVLPVSSSHPHPQLLEIIFSDFFLPNLISQEKTLEKTF